VVEDDAPSAEYFAAALGTAGATVVTAPTAVEALRAVVERRPDVVLSDIAMPGHDGYWLVQQLRALPGAAGRHVPVVATTAHGGSHSRDRALAAGFVDHLPKPVEPESLWAAIARAAGRAT
jgi:CheY-like chemotaxis protein